MARYRLPILLAGLLLLVAGTALATRVPRPGNPGTLAASQEPEAPPTADDLAHAVDRLGAAGIDASTDQLRQLAADYGLGGAVRLLAWADATGKSVAELRAMRDDGAGWGQLAHDLGVSPGIGTVMGQGSDESAEHGPQNAPGQQEPKPDDDDEGEAAESPGS